MFHVGDDLSYRRTVMKYYQNKFIGVFIDDTLFEILKI